MGPPPRLLALLLLLLPLLLRPAAQSPLGDAPARTRRGLLQLAGAIHCTTGRNPFAYMRYGCFCGYGGSGWPKDTVDWCCFQHDCCYGKAEKANCSPKLAGYTWECEDNTAKCDDIEDKCRKIACECDREAAKCFAKAPYNITYLFWPGSHCGEITPKCKDD